MYFKKKIIKKSQYEAKNIFTTNTKLTKKLN